MPQLGNYSFANPALSTMAMGGMQCGNSVLLVSNLNEQVRTGHAPRVACHRPNKQALYPHTRRSALTGS